jgi:hypothetical protein
MIEVPTRPANQPPGGSNEPEPVVWLVSYADDDDRQMTAEEIAVALRSGEIDMDCIVWRDGMAEWLPIAQVAPLRAELERLASRGDRRRTVMGGFDAGRRGPPLPSGAPPAPGAPRSTLLGTGAQLGVFGMAGAVQLGKASPEPQAAALDSSILESVRPSEEYSAPLPTIPKQSASAGITNLLKVRGEPESWEQEPTVSLTQDSIVSLPSEALESVVAFLPPMDPAKAGVGPERGIFEIDSLPPKAEVAAQPVVVARPRISERASESVLDEPSPVRVAPQIQVPGQSRVPGVPRPPERAATGAPVAQQLTFEPDQPQSRKRGGAAKFVVWGVLLLGVAFGMFYVGRQTAKTPELVQAPTGGVTGASAPSVPVPAAVASNAAAQGSGESAASAPTEAAASAPSASAPSSSPEAVSAAPRAPRGRQPTSSPPSNERVEPAPKAPAPEPPPAAEEASSDAPFNTGAASAALTQAAANASTCRKPGDPSGVASVTVTFSNSGRATNANISGPPFAGTVTGGCIASKMRQARVPPFGGDRITVRKQVVIQ